MAVLTVATIFKLAKKPQGPNVVHVTVSARSGGGSSLHRRRQRCRAPPTSCTFPSTSRCTSRCRARRSARHRAATPTRHPLVLDPGAQRQEGRRARPHAVPHASKREQAGTFLGQCAEYCGLSHANMRLRVIAQTKTDYDAWVQSQLQLPSATADLLKGINDSQVGLFAAATASRPRKPGAVAPNLTQLADRCAFAGDIYQTEFRQPVELDPRRARRVSRWATLSSTCRTSAHRRTVG